MKENKFDFEAFVRQAGEHLRSGKPLIGAEGVFSPLLKRVIEASLESELDEQLKDGKKEEKKNRRRVSTHEKISKAR